MAKSSKDSAEEYELPPPVDMTPEDLVNAVLNAGVPEEAEDENGK